MRKGPILLPPVYLLLSGILMLVLDSKAPWLTIVSYPWNWLGLPFVLGAGWLFVATVRLFRRAGTTIRPGSVSDQLLQEGPFRFSRNPIYLAMVVVLIGFAILLGSSSPWVVVPAFVALLSVDVIPVEERMLSERFGDAYKDYQKAVRRWF